MSSRSPRVADEPGSTLTERELDNLHLIGWGKSNAAVAAQLSLSVKTIANNVSNVSAKLQVANRAEAIVHARDAGLGGSLPAGQRICGLPPSQPQ